MTITAKKPDCLSHNLTAEITHKPLTVNCLNLVQHVEVTCHIRLGTLTLTIAELQQLTTGKIIKLQQSMQDPLDILVNQQVIARGELMTHDEFFAIHITEVCKT